MHYLLISFSHKNSDMTVREKLSLCQNEKESIIKLIVDSSYITECVLLSTCNRLEVITSVKNIHEAIPHILGVVGKFSGINILELEGRANILEDEGAVRHIFAVASALESVVIGEAQIAGQLRDALKYSLDNCFCGKRLSKLLEYAFRCAASVRNSTDIGKNPVSVSSAAVAQAKEIMGSLGGITAVVVGTGEMSRLAAQHLVAQDTNIIIVNRDFQKAQDLAKELGVNAKAEPFNNLSTLINSYRLLFTATGAPHAIITEDMVLPKEFRRYWFDIALPRDIGKIDVCNVRVFAVDDLKTIVKMNMSMREEEASKAYSIVGEFTENFYNWMQSLNANPTIKSLRQRAKASAEKELKRAIKKGFIPKEYEKNLEKVIHNSFKTFLHRPTIAIKDAMDKPYADDLMDSLNMLFDFDNTLQERR